MTSLMGSRAGWSHHEKHEGNPILVSDHPVEDNLIFLYGSVIRHPDDGPSG